MKFSSRTLWLFITVLAVTNLVTVGVALYLVERVDRSYSDVIDPTMPCMRDLHFLTQQLAEAHRAVLNLMQASDPAERELQQNRLTAAEKSTRVLLQRIYDAHAPGLDPSVEQGLQRAEDEYFRSASEVSRLAVRGEQAEALRLRRTSLRLNYEAFQELQAAAAAAISDSTVQTSADLTRSVGLLRRAVLTVIGLPAFALIAVGVAFGVFLGLLLQIFNRMQSDK